MKNFADLTEREVLAVAISAEEEDSRIYMTFAEDLKERYPDSAKLFEEMAEEERGHRHMLLELYEQRFGPHLPPIRRDDVKGFLRRRPVWLTKNLPLSDSAEAAASRTRFPGQAGRKPFTAICDTVTGDDYWTGARQSQEAQYITSIWTTNQGTYCTTQMEDTATATVLDRHGFLSRYLSLRTASDFDQPYAGQTTQAALATYPAAQPATDNAYLAGSTVVHYLLNHPPSRSST